MLLRLSLAAGLVILSACQLNLGPVHAGSGTLVTEPRETPFFDEIESQGSLDQPMRVVVKCPALKELSMLGSGDARFTGLD